ncbi:FG-GAP repeat domain-containing protein, partial [Candidatus Neomarinimicrobiota bacterium]
DLNKDGLLDIAFAHEKNIKIYYQNTDGNFTDPNIISVQAKTMTIGDVNNDGWLDLVCPYYKGNGKRTWYSTVLLGNAEGFRVDNSIQLPTNGGTGSLVCDYNRDGYNDIFFYCHREDGSFDEIRKYGDHHVNSILYWGSIDGFSNENIEELPSVGAHYDMGVDIGNIKDRTTNYIYTSSTHSTNGKNPKTLNWNGEVPQYSSLKFQLRSADLEESLQNADWIGPFGVKTYYTDINNTIVDVSGKWVQYRALFDTGNGANTPVLNSVEITFEK